jgi:hypothetical protein
MIASRGGGKTGSGKGGYIGPVRYSIGDKISGQMSSRGWTKNDISMATSFPSRTVKTTDTRYSGSSGIKNNDPATAYYHPKGGYVVRNDRTGDIVQISNRYDNNWKAPW